MHQNPAVVAQFDQIAGEFSMPIQAAGLRIGIIGICRADAATPDDLRRALVRQLQRTLPASVPASIRGAVSPQATGEQLARDAAKVVGAVYEQAHQSPTLRAVVTRDRAGRETTEFFGRKRGPGGWMEQYARQPLLMTAIGGAPTRIPTIL